MPAPYRFAGRYHEPLTDAYGNNLAAASVAVYDVGTTTLATLYTSATKGTTAANPVTSAGTGSKLDTLGNLTLFADPGVYDIVVTASGGAGPAVAIVVPLNPNEAAQLGSDGKILPSQVTAGEVVPPPATGGGNLAIQSTEPTVTANLLWVVTDAAGIPTGEMKVGLLGPAAPSNLAVAGVTYAAVTLTWTDNSTDETGFHVQRSATADFATAITFAVAANAVAGGTVTYENGGLAALTTYHYRVRSVRGTTRSAWSAAVSATTAAEPIINFDPATLSPHHWYKADALSLADGAGVATWTDSSGNGWHATDDLNAANRPVFRTGIVNSKPAVDFDGTDRLITSNYTSQPQPLTVLLVGSMRTAGKNYFDSSSRLVFGDWLVVNGSHEIYAGADAVGAAQAKPTGVNLWTLFFNGAESYIRKNRALFAGPGPNNIGAAASTNFYLGAFGANHLDGLVCEVIFVSRSLTSTELADCELHLKQKWATP